jgi:hypothetical protein
MKLFDKLKTLTKSRQTRFINGKQIKTSIVDGDYCGIKFQCENRKYRLAFKVEVNCDHNTFFIPMPAKLSLTNWTDGRYYQNEYNIAEFLNLTVDEVLEIFTPLIEDCVYTQDEINECRKNYDEAMISFRENFLI